jgi:hypothetical protein
MYATESGLGRGLSRRIYVLLGALAALLAVSFGPTVATASAGAMLRLPGCTANSLPANDDGSSTEEIALGYAVNFEGNEYSKVWVNNNGNVTFGGPLVTYTPEPIGSVGKPIIAPFWADVDTRSGSALTTYGTTTYQGHPAFCVEWDGVGYYSEHTNKLNKFELILVSRPDRAAGDFDILFNYDQIQWETGEASGGDKEGLGGTAPRVGFGLAGGGSEELSGSGTNGAFLDNGPAALVSGDENSTGPGSYLFPVIGGQPQGEPGLHGLVTSHNAALVGAAVQACPEGGGACHVTQTDGQGKYHFTGLPDGLWSVTVNPPSGDPIDLPTAVGPDQISGSAPVDQDVVMSTLTPPPSGTVIGGEGSFGNGQPTLDWHASTPISTNGCAGATAAQYEVVVPANSPSGKPRTIQTGPLSEGPSGTYKGTITPLAPFSGFAQIKITLTCPPPSAPVIGSFDIYVDPSGHVVDTTGAPVAGATVTLSSSASAAGPFTTVPNGSSIMAPNNRSNPSTTDSAGRFGWDVLAGFYEVTAAKAGCINPSEPTKSTVSTPVLTVPPPITDLKLTLNCDPLSGLTAVAQRDGSIKITFQATGAGSAIAHATTSAKVKVTVSKLVKKGRKTKKIKRKVLKLSTIAYGDAHGTIPGARLATITIAPSKKIKALLKKLKKLAVSVAVTFTPSPSGTPVSKTAAVTVPYVKPAKKKHHKHKHKHKKKHH